MSAKAGWGERSPDTQAPVGQALVRRFGSRSASMKPEPSFLPAHLAQTLQALAQGQLTRPQLAHWCQQQSGFEPGAGVLAAYLAQPAPTTALAMLHQAGPLWQWVQQAPPEIPSLVAGLWLEAAALLQHQGHPGEAETMLQTLCQLAPRLPEAWLLRARLQHLTAGPAAALKTLAEALIYLPDQLDLHSLQAQLWLQTGQADQALNDYLALAHRQPLSAEVWLGLGNLYQSQGELASARQAYERGLQLAPRHAGLWNNLGRVLQQQLLPAAAEEAYRQALSHQPQLVEAWNNLVALELDRGHLSEAMLALESLLPRAPGYAPAWINAGIAAGLAQQPEQAQQAFARARQLNPWLSEPWLEEISLLIRDRKRLQALELAQTARHQLPRSAELHWYTSRLLAAVDQPAAAQAAGQQALQLAPGRDFWRLQLELGWIDHFFLAPAAEQQAECTRLEQALAPWRGHFGFEALLPELRFMPELLWNLAYFGDGPHTRLSASMAAVFDFAPGTAPPGSTHGPLRLGILVSPQHEGLFLNCHSAWPLLRRLGPDFELVLIGDPRRLGPHLPPGAHLLPLPGHLPLAMEAIRAARLDLLYYWEVGSDSLNYFLPFFRLAPVQLTGWGTPISPGAPQLDYFCSSALNEPALASQHYNESLLLQADLPIWCEPLQSEPCSRRELDLPAGPLYVCLQTPLKYCPGLIQALADILRQDPEGHLLLLGSNQIWIQTRLEQALATAGAPAARIHWVRPPIPYPRFLRYLELADVVLDTRCYSGGQTSDEALLMGSPIVSFPGEAWRSRQTLGRLKLLQLEDCIADNWSDYVNTACALAHPGDRRNQVRSRLQSGLWRMLQNPAGVTQFAGLLLQAAREKGLR